MGGEIILVETAKSLIFLAIGAGIMRNVGFVTLHEHHALLVEHHGTQRQLLGEADTEHQTARKSFFRRLHEAKRPDLAINAEIVYCMVKPAIAPRIAHRMIGMSCPASMRAYLGPAVDVCVSSPPYVHSVHDGNGIDQTKFKAMVNGQRETPGQHTQAQAEGYGCAPGQLGAMAPGHAPSLAPQRTTDGRE